MNCAELDTFLNCYLDGEFDFPERTDFEHHLAECAQCARRIADQVKVRHAFRAALQSAGKDIAAPPALRQRILAELNRSELHALKTRWLAVAAAVAVVAVGGSYMIRPRERQRMVDEAALRHARALPPEVREGATEKVEAWFGGKLDHRVSVPRFPNVRLAGARMSHVTDKPAAHITYEQDDRHGGGYRRMGLFVFEDAKREVDAEALPAVQVAESHGYNVAYWRQGEIVYELVSDLDEQDIRNLLATASKWAKTDESRPAPDRVSTFPTPSQTVPASFIPASFQQ